MPKRQARWIVADHQQIVAIALWDIYLLVYVLLEANPFAIGFAALFYFTKMPPTKHRLPFYSCYDDKVSNNCWFKETGLKRSFSLLFEIQIMFFFFFWWTKSDIQSKRDFLSFRCRKAHPYRPLARQLGLRNRSRTSIILATWFFLQQYSNTDLSFLWNINLNARNSNAKLRKKNFR